MCISRARAIFSNSLWVRFRVINSKENFWIGRVSVVIINCSSIRVRIVDEISWMLHSRIDNQWWYQLFTRSDIFSCYYGSIPMQFISFLCKERLKRHHSDMRLNLSWPMSKNDLYVELVKGRTSVRSSISRDNVVYIA